MKGAEHTGPLVAAMFLGWPFAQLVQNRGIAERPLVTAVVALTAVGIGYLCVFRPVTSAVGSMQGSPSRARTILRGAIAIVLLVLIASASARIAEAWDRSSMASEPAFGSPPLLLVTVLAAGFGSIGRLSTPGLARLVLATNLGSCALLLASLLWFAWRANAPPQIDEIHWSWTLDGLAYMFPAMAVAGATTAIVRRDPGRAHVTAWVVCAAGYSVTLSLLIQEAAMSGYYVNQLDQLGSVVDIADSEAHIWALVLSLTGAGPAIVASLAIRDLVGRRTPWLIVAAAWAWTLERELGFGEGPLYVALILSLVLSLTWVNLAGGFLCGKGIVRGRLPADLLSKRRMELVSAVGVSLMLLLLIAAAAVSSAQSASGAGWIAILAPFIGAVGIGVLSEIRDSAKHG